MCNISFLKIINIHLFKNSCIKLDIVNKYIYINFQSKWQINPNKFKILLKIS